MPDEAVQEAVEVTAPTAEDETLVEQQEAVEPEVVETPQEVLENPVVEQPSVETSALQAQITALQEEVASGAIVNAMLASGVDSKIVQRAARMIDRDKVIKNGVVDDSALQAEIVDLHKDFPAIAGTTSDTIPGLIIGADAEAETTDKEAAQDAAIHKALMGK